MYSFFHSTNCPFHCTYILLYWNSYMYWKIGYRLKKLNVWLWPKITGNLITKMSDHPPWSIILCAIWYMHHTFPYPMLNKSHSTELQWKTFPWVTVIWNSNWETIPMQRFFYLLVSILAWNNTVISGTNSLTWNEFGYKHTCQYSLFIAQIPHKHSVRHACTIWLIHCYIFSDAVALLATVMVKTLIGA